MADKTKDFIKRRKELAGLSALTTSVNKNSPVRFSSALKDMPKPKPTTVSKVASSIFKKSPIGRIVDTAVKIGAGAGAGYEYAKSKFTDQDKKNKKEKTNVDKKKLGGMNKSKLKKAAMIGTTLLASNYLGKRAGEADAALNAAKRISGTGEFEKPSAFGFSMNPENRIKSKLNLSKGGDVEIVKGGDYIKDLL